MRANRPRIERVAFDPDWEAAIRRALGSDLGHSVCTAIEPLLSEHCNHVADTVAISVNAFRLLDSASRFLAIVGMVVTPERDRPYDLRDDFSLLSPDIGFPGGQVWYGAAMLSADLTDLRTLYTPYGGTRLLGVAPSRRGASTSAPPVLRRCSAPLLAESLRSRLPAATALPASAATDGMARALARTTCALVRTIADLAELGSAPPFGNSAPAPSSLWSDLLFRVDRVLCALSGLTASMPALSVSWARLSECLWPTDP